MSKGRVISALFAALIVCVGSQSAVVSAQEFEAVQYQELEELTAEELAAFEEYVASDDQSQFDSEDINVVDEATAERWATLSRYSSRTSNYELTWDKRVGLLGLENGGFCTAGYIGKGFWITAEHCVHGNEGAVGYVAQKFGQNSAVSFAGIEGIWVPNRSHDVAIVKVGSGLNANAFDLSPIDPKEGQKLTVNGYGRGVGTPYLVNVPSQTSFKVTGNKDSVTYNGFDGTLRYKDLVDAVPMNGFHMMKGDSGAPAWSGNAIYGIASGISGTNAIFAKTASDVDWIVKFKDSYRGPSLGNRFRSWKGGLMASQHYRERLSG